MKERMESTRACMRMHLLVDSSPAHHTPSRCIVLPPSLLHRPSSLFISHTNIITFQHGMRNSTSACAARGVPPHSSTSGRLHRATHRATSNTRECKDVDGETMRCQTADSALYARSSASRNKCYTRTLMQTRPMPTFRIITPDNMLFLAATLLSARV
jgi:hypothetical protein